MHLHGVEMSARALFISLGRHDMVAPGIADARSAPKVAVGTKYSRSKCRVSRAAGGQSVGGAQWHRLDGSGSQEAAPGDPSSQTAQQAAPIPLQDGQESKAVEDRSGTSRGIFGSHEVAEVEVMLRYEVDGACTLTVHGSVGGTDLAQGASNGRGVDKASMGALLAVLYNHHYHRARRLNAVVDYAASTFPGLLAPGLIQQHRAMLKAGLTQAALQLLGFGDLFEICRALELPVVGDCNQLCVGRAAGFAWPPGELAPMPARNVPGTCLPGCSPRVWLPDCMQKDKVDAEMLSVARVLQQAVALKATTGPTSEARQGLAAGEERAAGPGNESAGLNGGSSSSSSRSRSSEITPEAEFKKERAQAQAASAGTSSTLHAEQASRQPEPDRNGSSASSTSSADSNASGSSSSSGGGGGGDGHGLTAEQSMGMGALALAMVPSPLWEAWRERLRGALVNWAEVQEKQQQQQDEQQRSQEGGPAAARGTVPDKPHNSGLPAICSFLVNARTPDGRSMSHLLQIRLRGGALRPTRLARCSMWLDQHQMLQQSMLSMWYGVRARGTTCLDWQSGA